MVVLTVAVVSAVVFVVESAFASFVEVESEQAVTINVAATRQKKIREFFMYALLYAANVYTLHHITTNMFCTKNN